MARSSAASVVAVTVVPRSATSTGDTAPDAREPGHPELGPLGTLLGQLTIAGNIVLGFDLLGLGPSYALLLAVPAAGCLILAPREALLRTRVSVSAMLLLGWMVMSVGWSVDVDVTISALSVRVPPLLGLMAVVGVLPSRDVLRAVLRTIQFVVVLQIFSLLFMPGSISFSSGSWRGSFVSKNDMGIFMAAAGGVVLAVERGWRRIILLTAIVVLLVGANSSTAMFAAVFVVFVWFWLGLWHRRPRRSGFIIAMGTILLVGVVSVAAAATFESVVDATGKDPTLTGRTEIWDSALRVIGDSPIVGYGFDAFMNITEPTSTTYDVWSRLPFRPPHAHNGVIDAAGQLGAVGVALSLCVVGATILDAMRGYRFDPAASTAIVLVTAQTVSALAEPYLLGKGWLVLTLLVRTWSMGLSPAVRTSRPQGAGREDSTSRATLAPPAASGTS